MALPARAPSRRGRIETSNRESSQHNSTQSHPMYLPSNISLPFPYESLARPSLQAGATQPPQSGSSSDRASLPRARPAPEPRQATPPAPRSPRCEPANAWRRPQVLGPWGWWALRRALGRAEQGGECSTTPREQTMEVRMEMSEKIALKTVFHSVCMYRQ